jgi:hypothetical protein
MSEMRCCQTTLRDLREKSKTRNEDFAKDEPSHGV